MGLACALTISLNTEAAIAYRDSQVQLRLISDALPQGLNAPTAVGVAFEIQPGWHIYWRNSGDSGKATQITWRQNTGLQYGPLLWPTPQRYLDRGGITTYGYEGQVLLLSPLKTAPATPQAMAAAEVEWLACNTTCIPRRATLSGLLPQIAAGPQRFRAASLRLPQPLSRQPTATIQATATTKGLTLRLSFPAEKGWHLFGDAGHPFFLPYSPAVKMAAESEAPGLLTATLFAAPEAPLRGVVQWRNADEGGRAEQYEVDLVPAPAAPPQEHFFHFLLLALLGGILLNLMPCVLPVLSLKVLALLEEKEKEPRARRLEGWAYSAGVLASFLALALLLLLLRSAGLAVGWGFQFQEPRFVIFMFLLLVFFALNLLGVFEIAAPFSLAPSATGSSPRTAFLNGATATLLSTPCTAPFLGTALGFALSRSPLEIVLFFLAIGAGLASPWLLLSHFPGAGRLLLPRPGRWMEGLKKGLGLPLLATALWLLAVLTRLCPPPTWIAALLLAAALAVGTAIYGALQRRGRPSFRRRCFAAAMTLTLLGTALTALDFSPRRDPPAALPLAWAPFDPLEIERQTASGRPVFVDFTASWCLTCQANEWAVLQREETQRLFARQRVLAMRADYTQRDPQLTIWLKKYRRAGVPLYLLFPPRDGSQPLVLPEILTPAILKTTLEESRP